MGEGKGLKLSEGAFFILIFGTRTPITWIHLTKKCANSINQPGRKL